MSDHIDGPRQIGDPASDLTDLFAFTSPENPDRTVLAANVFPTCGVHAFFSNAVNYSIMVRPAKVAGLGNAAKFEVSDPEIRFQVRFGPLENGGAGAAPVQRGTCTLPDGQTVRVVVNDERGTRTPDGAFRVFAGLRSDPFILSMAPSGKSDKPASSILDHDNVLCIAIEFETKRVLEPELGTLFAAAAETTPLPGPRAPVGHPPVRLDWVGRPEQTNMRFDNPGLKKADDLRDLWNQQTPFALAPEHRPLFLKRLLDSLSEFDGRDGMADWTPSALAGNANVLIDDFLLFDVTKPITDDSHFEIEKSTLGGRAYTTGGGRTVDANVFDILLRWLINHDREPLRGRATSALRPGTTTFPYFAPPDTEMQVVSESVTVDAAPGKLWELIGKFDALWNPLAAEVRQVGTGVGALRYITGADGRKLIERLEEHDGDRMFYRYSLVSGIPASDYSGTLQVKPAGTGSIVEWRVQFLGSGQGTIVARTIVSALLKAGLESLKKRFEQKNK